MPKTPAAESRSPRPAESAGQNTAGPWPGPGRPCASPPGQGVIAHEDPARAGVLRGTVNGPRWPTMVGNKASARVESWSFGPSSGGGKTDGYLYKRAYFHLMTVSLECSIPRQVGNCASRSAYDSLLSVVHRPLLAFTASTAGDPGFGTVPTRDSAGARAVCWSDSPSRRSKCEARNVSNKRRNGDCSSDALRAADHQEHARAQAGIRW